MNLYHGSYLEIKNPKILTPTRALIRGRFSVEETIKRLQPYDLVDQYTFTNQKALSYLTYKGVEHVAKN